MLHWTQVLWNRQLISHRALPSKYRHHAPRQLLLTSPIVQSARQTHVYVEVLGCKRRLDPINYRDRSTAWYSSSAVVSGEVIEESTGSGFKPEEAEDGNQRVLWEGEPRQHKDVGLTQERRGIPEGLNASGIGWNNLSQTISGVASRAGGPERDEGSASLKCLRHG